MKNLELAYLAVAYGMAGIMFYASQHASLPTLSHIAVSQKLTRQVFFWGLTTSGLLFAILMYGWAIPHFSLGVGVKVLVGLLVACQVLTGLFPIEDKRLHRMHLIFGSGLGLCMFILLIVLALSPTIHQVARLADGLLALCMVALFTTARWVKNGNYLRYEKLFFGFWHLAIFTIVYVG